MRITSVIVASVVVAGAASLAAQSAPAQGAQPAGRATTAQPAGRAQAAGRGAAAQMTTHGNLAQLMRGIMFPNSNLIFFSQDTDPATIKPAPDPSTATDPLQSAYGGWQAVQNAGIALAESANLLLIPGRTCSNGRPMPINDPDWGKFVQELRDAGNAAAKAALSRNLDNMLMAADTMTTACGNCHDKFREKPKGVAERCLP
jgi:hypothetical protein